MRFSRVGTVAPHGSYPDVNIFRLSMKNTLRNGERVVADGGYEDERRYTTKARAIHAGIISKIRARHETVNRRIKHFFVASHRFRHNIKKHAVCFHAACNLTHMMIKNGEPVFTLEA